MGIIERRARDRQKRIKEILDGAKLIFSDKGFHKSTMNDIAAMSDLSRRTLYLYFKNKEEILLTIAENSLEKELKNMDHIFNSDKTGLECILYFIESYKKEFMFENSNYQLLPNFTLCINELGEDNEVVEKVKQTVNTIRELIAKLLERGSKDGSIRAIKNYNKTAAVLISLVHSFILSVDVDNALLTKALNLDPEEFFYEIITAIKNYLSPTIY
jgi:AcrR family transcriptional regulator